MSFRLRQSAQRLRCLAAALAAFTSFEMATPALATVVRNDEANVKSTVPVYEWKKPGSKPRAIAVAVHGLVMHGAVYDALARQLAEQDFLVYAPDLRGYGRCQKQHVDYDRSYQDLQGLVRSLKNEHPGLPLYVIGESLGADMALRVGSEQSQLVDGLILSSPAIKHHSFLPAMAAKAGIFMLEPYKQFNLVPYIKRFASEDPRIVQETLEDPLVRKHLSAWQLLRTISYLRPALNYAEKLPESMPVLIIQGNKDRMVRTNGVVLLLAKLKSTDQTVRWFADRGHLLLETAYMQQETLETVTDWLSEHVRTETRQTAELNDSDSVATN